MMHGAPTNPRPRFAPDRDEERLDADSKYHRRRRGTSPLLLAVVAIGLIAGLFLLLRTRDVPVLGSRRDAVRQRARSGAAADCRCPAPGNEGDDTMDNTPIEDMAALGPERYRDASPLPRQLQNLPTFTLVNMATEQKTWLQKSLLNKQQYVRRHGYSWELHLETLAENDAVWSKIPAMELALFGVSSVPNLDLDVPPGHRTWGDKLPVKEPKTGRDHWAWWLDIDTLITNHSITLNSIVKAAEVVFAEQHNHSESRPELEIILSRDCNGINAGSLFLRRSPWVQRFLALLWSLRDELPKLDEDKRSEQDAIVYLYERRKEIRDRTTFLPQYVLNGNPDDIGCTEFFADDTSGRTWKVGSRLGMPGATPSNETDPASPGSPSLNNPIQ